jgi:hypothetical protein
MNRLTHKGKSLADLKHFNDMHFEKDNEYDDMGEDSADFG